MAKYQTIVLGSKRIKIKKGALHKQLGIPEDQPIPMALLNKILSSAVGDVVEYTVNGEKRRIKVTPLLLKRASLAKTLKRLK